MADISKKAAKKARKREKLILSKQTAQPDIQLATKSGPIAATSPPVSSNTATSAPTTLATGTVKTVAELDAKLLCMKQRWAQTSTSPLPEGIRNAVMDLQAALVTQEAVAVQPVEVPAYNVQVSRNGEKQGDIRRGKMSGKQMRSVKRGAGEQGSRRRRARRRRKSRRYTLVTRTTACHPKTPRITSTSSHPLRPHSPQTHLRSPGTPLHRPSLTWHVPRLERPLTGEYKESATT
jgi:hypothetical protein